MKRGWGAIVFLALALPAIAQQDRPTRYFAVDPVNPCSVITPLVNNWVNGKLWQCQGAAGVNNGTWHLVSAGALGAATWGDINGTLSAQTDLQTALNAKLSAASNLSDLVTPATARTNLGLGTAATQSTGTFFQVANNLSEGTAATMRTNLGLGAAATHGATVTVNGTACTLDSVCSPSASAVWGSITGTLSSQTDLQTALNLRLAAASNLSDVGSASTSRTNLGLGTAATQSTGTFFQVANNLSEGTAATMRTNLGLGSLAVKNAAACGDLPALVGDATTAGATCTTAVAKINGGTVPASAHLVGTNGSSQPIAATSHDPSVIADCVAASASGTTYTCATSPTFTPAAGDSIIFEADVASTGAATLNVNSAGAKGIKKQGGGTAIIANDLLVGQWMKMIYDGTNWQMQGQLGNAGSGLTVSTGLCSALPSTSGQLSGNMYKCTDVDYNFIFDGAAWQPYFAGLNVVRPVLANYAWQSQGSATLSTTTTSITLSRNASEASFNVHAYVVTAPATPYHAIFGYRARGNTGANIGAGVTFSDGTKYELAVLPFTDNGANFVAFYNTTNTANSSTPLNTNAFTAPVGYPPLMFVRLGDDGTTNKTIDVGSSPTGPWTTIFTEGRTVNETPTKVGIFLNGGPTLIELFHASFTS